MSVYKGEKLVAGGSIDTHFVRNPAWNQAVTISAEQLYAGYTAPSDGIFVCTGVMPTANNDIHRIITVNGIAIVMGQYNSTSAFSYGSTSCPVNEGDLIKSNTNKAWSDETRCFVPFEDSTVSESDIEVVTPEYIRNQNILSDWEDITISTSKSSPTVMPYDGFIYSFTGHTVVLYINTTPFSISNHTNISGNGACMVAVRKGDKVYVSKDSESTEKVAYYKLRDYTGR